MKYQKLSLLCIAAMLHANNIQAKPSDQAFQQSVLATENELPITDDTASSKVAHIQTKEKKPKSSKKLTKMQPKKLGKAPKKTSRPKYKAGKAALPSHESSGDLSGDSEETIRKEWAEWRKRAEQEQKDMHSDEQEYKRARFVDDFGPATKPIPVTYNKPQKVSRVRKKLHEHIEYGRQQ